MKPSTAATRRCEHCGNSVITAYVNPAEYPEGEGEEENDNGGVDFELVPQRMLGELPAYRCYLVQKHGSGDLVATVLRAGQIAGAAKHGQRIWRTRPLRCSIQARRQATGRAATA